VYDHSVRVPMLIRGPGISPALFREVGSHVDLAPTFLALSGLDPPSVSGPPIDGKSLLPWLLAGADTHSLPAATRVQLARERARLGMLPAPTAAPPRVRSFAWIEYFAQGNLWLCGGGSPNGSWPEATAGGRAGGVIKGSTCQADRHDGYGYCHMPCPHSPTGATPLNSTCDLKFCVNATCCLGVNDTQFSPLEGMRCGAGHRNGSLPFDSSADPGHQVDCLESNQYRALRFIEPTPGGRGNVMYAEFTRRSDLNFTAADKFVEIFNLDEDPGQLVNLVNSTSEADLAFYRETARKQFACSGAACD
jgi:hypothetical protein